MRAPPRPRPSGRVTRNCSPVCSASDLNVLFLQPAAHVAALGVDLGRFRHVARFGIVNLASLPRKLRTTGAIVNCIDTSAAARLHRTKCGRAATESRASTCSTASTTWPTPTAIPRTAGAGWPRWIPCSTRTWRASTDGRTRRSPPSAPKRTPGFPRALCSEDDDPDPAQSPEAAFLDGHRPKSRVRRRTSERG